MRRKGFSLVELIVVMAILSVLSILSFLVLNKWLINSRNSKRLADLNVLSKALVINIIDKGKYSYPIPGSGINIYDGSGNLIATQGLFDEDVYNHISDSLSRFVKDPLEEYYGYTVIHKRQGFELITLIEDTDLFGNNFSERSIAIGGKRIPYTLIYHDKIINNYKDIDIFSYVYKDKLFSKNLLGDNGKIILDNTNKMNVEVKYSLMKGKYKVLSVKSISGEKRDNIFFLDVMPALPISNGYYPIGLNTDLWSLKDEELKYVLDRRYSQGADIVGVEGCDFDKMNINNTNFRGNTVVNYGLEDYTIYRVYKGNYNLSNSVYSLNYPGKCIVLIGESKKETVFSFASDSSNLTFFTLISNFSISGNYKLKVYFGEKRNKILNNVDIVGINSFYYYENILFYKLKIKGIGFFRAKDIHFQDSFLSGSHLSIINSTNIYFKDSYITNLTGFSDDKSIWISSSSGIVFDNTVFSNVKGRVRIGGNTGFNLINQKFQNIKSLSMENNHLFFISGFYLGGNIKEEIDIRLNKSEIYNFYIKDFVYSENAGYTIRINFVNSKIDGLYFENGTGGRGIVVTANKSNIENIRFLNIPINSLRLRLSGSVVKGVYNINSKILSIESSSNSEVTNIIATNAGLGVSRSNNLFINHCIMFNSFLYLNSSNKISVNNCIIFNMNKGLSIAYGDANNLNNIYIYNTFFGLYYYRSGYTIFNDIYLLNSYYSFYVNSYYSFYANNFTGKFYGNIWLIDNNYDTFWNDPLVKNSLATSGYSGTDFTGAILYTGSNIFNCDYAVKILANDGKIYFSDDNCKNRGYIEAFSGKFFKSFIFGKNIPNQKQPYKRSGDQLIKYGSFDPNKKIGQR